VKNDNDVGFVNEGQRVKVKLAAYPFRNMEWWKPWTSPADEGDAVVLTAGKALSFRLCAIQELPSPRPSDRPFASACEFTFSPRPKAINVRYRLDNEAEGMVTDCKALK
jgi:hypothetical protein